MLVFLALRYASRTPFGLALQGLRDEPARMRALGFDVTRHRMLAFGLAAFVAAIAGLLSVWYNRRISPGSISLAQTIDVLIIAVVGGLYRLEGAWVGALVYALLDNYSREYTPEIGNVLGPERFNTLIGIVFLVIVLLSPGGLVGLWESGREQLARRRPGGGSPGAGSERGRGRPRDRRCQVTRATNRGEGVLRARKLLALGSAVVALGLVGGCGGDDEPSDEPAADATAEAGGTIKVGFLSDCEGDFGSFFEPTIAGFNLGLIDAGRRQPAARSRPTASRAPRSPARTSRSSATAAPTPPPTRRSRRRAA